MDLNETIINYLRGEIASIHIGETVPQEITTDYIFIQRQGDILGEQLNWPPVIEAAVFDVECVSLDIAECRSLTENAREIFRNSPMHELSFSVNETTTYRRIQAFDVEDHSDDYVAHSIPQDAELHVGAFRLTAYLSDPFINA